MKMTALILLLVLHSIFVSAQTDCDPDKIKTAPGTWITRGDQNTGGLTAAELAAERKLIASIHQIFRDNYQHVGVSISFAPGF
ncbi:MAG: hypothetical protein QM594_08235 [Niabella sp.]